MSKFNVKGWMGSFAGLVAALLAVAMTADARADFLIYVTDNVNGDVYAIPNTFNGNAVGAGQVFASGYTTGGTGLYAIEGSGTTLYISEADGHVFTKSASSAPGGTGTAFVNLGTTTYDITIADSGNLQAVGGTSSTTTTVVNPVGSVIGTYTHASGDVIAGIEYAPGDGIYISEGTHIQHLTGSGTSYTDATSPGLAADAFSSPEFLQQVIKGTDGNLYVSDFKSSSGRNIFRINPLTGAESQVLATDAQVVIASGPNAGTYTSVNPLGVEEGPDGRLYFTDYQNGRLFSINLDGTDPELVATGLSTNGPVGIAFTTPEPASMSLLVLGGAALLQRRRRR